jgi:hypothetical protein
MSTFDWLDSESSFDELVPKTSIDHLLSEEERQKAEEERREFETVGRSMFLTEESLYPIFYAGVYERIAAGVSQDEIRAEMAMLADTPDDTFAAIARTAYEDALAGRPPKFSSPWCPDIGGSPGTRSA